MAPRCAGAFIPGTNLGVAVVQANINIRWRHSRPDLPDHLTCVEERNSVGVSAMGERPFNSKSRHALAAGFMVAAHKIDGEDPAVAMAATATAIAFRLAARERWEIDWP